MHHFTHTEQTHCNVTCTNKITTEEHVLTSASYTSLLLPITSISTQYSSWAEDKHPSYTLPVIPHKQIYIELTLMQNCCNVLNKLVWPDWLMR